jgi:hypothetical protein
MLKASVKRLKKDPRRSLIRRLELDVIDHYDTVVDPAKPVKERLKSAKALAITLVRNEADHHNGKLGFCDRYSDDLNRLIKEYIESRFDEDANKRRRVKASAITAPARWGSFLWRGAMLSHLYAINNYRNVFEHIDEQPYQSRTHDAQAWVIPPEVLHSVESGEAASKLIELTVKDLLDWYLPWHEQVYLPWAKSQPRSQQ